MVPKEEGLSLMFILVWLGEMVSNMKPMGLDYSFRQNYYHCKTSFFLDP